MSADYKSIRYALAVEKAEVTKDLAYGIMHAMAHSMAQAGTTMKAEELADFAWRAVTRLEKLAEDRAKAHHE